MHISISRLSGLSCAIWFHIFQDFFNNKSWARMEAEITSTIHHPSKPPSVMDDMFCDLLILSHCYTALGLNLITLTFISIIIIIKIILTRSIIIIQHTGSRTINITKKGLTTKGYNSKSLKSFKLFLFHSLGMYFPLLPRFPLLNHQSCKILLFHYKFHQ